MKSDLLVQRGHSDPTSRRSARSSSGALDAFLRDADTLAVADVTLEEALRWALELVCAHSGWPLGHVFRFGPDGETLVSAGIWHDRAPERHGPFVAATAALELRRGEGISGHVIATGEPIWLADLARELPLPRRQSAPASGLRAAFAFPILSDEGAEGVIEIFSWQPTRVDGDLLALAAHVGRQVGRVLDRDRMRQRLREAERLAQLATWTWDLDARRLLLSPEMYSMHGVEVPEAAAVATSLSLGPGEWRGLVAGELADRGEALVDRVLATGQPAEIEYQVKRGRSTRWLRAHAEIVERHDGRPARVSGYTQDVTAQKRAEQRRLRIQRELAHHQRVLERIARSEPLEETLIDLCRHVERLFPAARCSVLVLDRTAGRLRHAAGPSLPPSFLATIDGLPAAEGMAACGTAAARRERVVVADVFDDPLTSAFHDVARRHGIGSVWSHPLITADGTVLGTFALYQAGPHRPTRAEIRAVTAAGHLAGLAIERSRLEASLHAAANRDSVTGLPNRARFLELAGAELAAPGRAVSVLFLTIDRFRQVADSLGHIAGERILVEVAGRLRTVVGSRGLVARFGGQEFTVMVAGASAAEVDRLADRVLEAVETPISVDGGEFFLTASVGIARGEHPLDAYELVRNADAALSAARARGRGTWQRYDRRVRARAIERLGQEAELRRAIERRELVVHYQPILDLVRRAWSGVEALVRWQHPRRGLVPPDEFIPLAEETGLITPLGNRVLELVAAQAVAWERRLPGISIAANASVVQLADPAMPDDLLDLFARSGVSPDVLRLEVTESALMEELDTARSALEQLMRAGVPVLIDDFGTGYSSIARLGELPISGLKIDRRFTAGLGVDSSVRPVLQAIADLARAYGLQVVAEGIEDARALLDAGALGCRFAQGYHLGAPAPADSVEAVLRRPPPLHARH